MPEPTYDLDYALSRLRDAIDYAEQTGEFTQARKWVNEVALAVAECRPIIPFDVIDNTTMYERHPELFVEPNTVLVDTLPGEQSAEGGA